MQKKLLSDFSKVLSPSYHPDTFRPYLSMMITIVFTTFLVYGFQIVTSNLYLYANNPSAFQNKMQTKLCGEFAGNSFIYICKNTQSFNIKFYGATSLLSFEQDLHKVTNCSAALSQLRSLTSCATD